MHRKSNTTGSHLCGKSKKVKFVDSRTVVNMGKKGGKWGRL